jgi:hypothetical protein
MAELESIAVDDAGIPPPRSATREPRGDPLRITRKETRRIDQHRVGTGPGSKQSSGENERPRGKKEPPPALLRPETRRCRRCR